MRAPILTILGHVDHGKTTLADYIRGTAVVRKEPGQITQWIGCSFVPAHVIERIAGPLLQKYEVKLIIPGLLFIDTPGHEAFTTLRRKGGSVADLGILVIDIMEGFQPQTDESLGFLRHFNTPFVVAATKIDLIPGWYPVKGESFATTLERQRPDVEEELEKRVYTLVTQLAERGFDAERYDRVKDFTRQIAIVPTSGLTGEGVADLLMVLAGLAQRFLKERLELSKEARGAVLEVKETLGLGITVDVVLYDGSVRIGDWMVIGGRKPITARVRALLIPPALRELRVEKRFERVREVKAAAGIKIAASGLEDVVAGSPVRFVSSGEELEEARTAVQREVEEVTFRKDVEGVVVKADTLGSLEALVKMLTDRKVPIRKAEIGKVVKEDLVDVQSVRDELKRVVLAFNVKSVKEAEELAKGLRIPIFSSNIIYRLIEGYEKWCLEERERRLEELLAKAARPCKLRMLGKDFVFRKSKPAIFGVEVLAGIAKPRTKLCRPDGKVVGEIRRIEHEGKALPEAKAGEKVAISVEGITIGRQVGYEDVLISHLGKEDLKALKDAWEKLREDEKELLREWKLV